MARKSRKRQTVTLPHLHSETAGYIRLSVTGKGGDDSIENQKKVIEAWARENQHPISRWYIDAGWSGRTFYRPMFRELIADIERGEVDCVVVKDLSRLGRDHIAVGYYLEVFFPMNCVRFVSINDDFDTVNGLTDQSHPHGARIRIPIKNAFNEQVAVEIKQKVEATLQMKIDRGTFVGPRAPFGYQKSEANHDQLVPDPIASITVRKIFELAANGTGVTGIVRYLNEKGLPTPIQYARSNGLTGSFADGTGDWNSRSVKYILTNRTYTGMLIQGKEKRVVKGTHEPLVDVETFDRIQSEFKARSFNSLREYCEYYHPIILRYDKKAKVGFQHDCDVFNYGGSKGATYERVVIIPVSTTLPFIERQVKITSNQTRAKFYVACTRAKHSVVFAMESPCENGVFKATDIHFSDKSIPAYKFSKPGSDI